MRKRLPLAVGLILFCALLLAGCQTTTGRYLGAKAERETITLLRDAVIAKQHWQDRYVSVDYSVQQQGTLLVTEGVFNFSYYPQLNLVQVRNFRLKLFLLNRDSIVVDYFDLSHTVGPPLSEAVAFNKSVEISSEVTALSFGYEGTFIDEIGAREVVWKLPKLNF